ncbi:hypothetical protein MHU86_2823 [Fragilaria crotonensis]|nr:hypothetical protein MHU86_2823 [Fragilaria crotonensis]
MEKSNQTQQNISSDMEDMKAHTAQQFEEMNKRLLSNMEGQDKISTTMLDLREHFEKMSSFIESLANKMELDRKKAARKSLSQTTSIPRGHSVDASVESCTSRSTSNASTTSGSSIKSKSSVQSTASSTEYRSPEKKKQRSHGKHGTLPTMATHSDGISSDDFEECQSPEFMELCTNLDHDAFRSLDDSRHHTNIQRDDITQRDPTKSRGTFLRFSTTCSPRSTIQHFHGSSWSGEHMSAASSLDKRLAEHGEPMADQTTDTLLEKAQHQWKNLFSRPISPTMTSKFKEQGRRQPSLLTRGNQRENEPWGDLLSGKAPLITRVYIQNVNGLSIDRRGGQLNDICEVIRETQADIFVEVRSFLLSATFQENCQPSQDRWGRWVIQEFSGRAGIKLIIVSAYQPVDRRGHEGNLTVASQHRSLLLQTQDALNNPRSAFRRDLLETLRTYKKAGSDILLVGDFNEPFGSDHDGLSFIAAELQLVNLGNYRHSSKVPATYARGSRCLDYALGSARVRDALISMGYESFNARLSSDHRGYFLDFDTQKLFGSLTPDLATSARRMLKANNPHQVTAYINKMYELLQEHNAFARGKRLTFLGNRHQFAERLDRDLLAASLAAEASIPQFGEHAWSAELSMARRRVQYLKKCLSITKSGLDLTQIQQEYAPEFQTTTFRTIKSNVLVVYV